jgi:hypothetical protein
MRCRARQSSAAILLLACLTPVTAQDRVAARALVVIDLRPAEERTGIGLSPLTGICNENVYSIADSASKPPKVDALQSELEKALGDAGAGKTLTVLDWTIYYNKQMYGRQQHEHHHVAVVLPGLGPRFDRPGSVCPRQWNEVGWFDRSEVIGNYSPLISEFKGTYAGTSVAVRIVHSPQRKLGQFTGDPGDASAVLDAVHETAAALLAIIPQ